MGKSERTCRLLHTGRVLYRAKLLLVKTMARTSLLTIALLAAVAFCGLRSAFVPAPSSTQVNQQALQGVAASSGAFLAAVAADPAFAESMDSAEVYNRKILTAGSYALIPTFFLFGLIISQARKMVENKWLA